MSKQLNIYNMKTQESKTRHEQMQDAERARKILSLIEWQIIQLQFLPNNQIMSNKLFRMALKENQDLQKRFDIFNKRKDQIKRFIWENA